MSNSLDQNQIGHFVRPDMGPNCLQRLPADNTTVKPVLSCHLKIGRTKVLKTDGSLLQV